MGIFIFLFNSVLAVGLRPWRFPDGPLERVPMPWEQQATTTTTKRNAVKRNVVLAQTPTHPICPKLGDWHMKAQHYRHPISAPASVEVIGLNRANDISFLLAPEARLFSPKNITTELVGLPYLWFPPRGQRVTVFFPPSLLFNSWVMTAIDWWQGTPWTMIAFTIGLLDCVIRSFWLVGMSWQQVSQVFLPCLALVRITRLWTENCG